MGRELRRVPMNFNYPRNRVWYGYFIGAAPACISTNDRREYCEQCKETAQIKAVPMSDYGCPDWDDYLAEPVKKLKELLAPPTGDGYQLWETTSEGSPISPVFETLDALCEWCEKNATTFADCTATKEQWKAMLENDFVHHGTPERAPRGEMG